MPSKMASQTAEETTTIYCQRTHTVSLCSCNGFSALPFGVKVEDRQIYFSGVCTLHNSLDHGWKRDMADNIILLCSGLTLISFTFPPFPLLVLFYAEINKIEDGQNSRRWSKSMHFRYSHFVLSIFKWRSIIDVGGGHKIYLLAWIVNA